MAQEHTYGHMVQEYYVERVRAVTEERRAARAGIKTKAQFERLQAEIRRKLRRAFGPMPKRTPLEVRTTGRLERDTYTIEKLIYHSRPNFPVTANLYLPTRGRGPFPAVLGTCGHATEARASRSIRPSPCTWPGWATWF